MFFDVDPHRHRHRHPSSMTVKMKMRMRMKTATKRRPFFRYRRRRWRGGTATGLLRPRGDESAPPAAEALIRRDVAVRPAWHGNCNPTSVQLLLSSPCGGVTLSWCRIAARAVRDKGECTPSPFLCRSATVWEQPNRERRDSRPKSTRVSDPATRSPYCGGRRHPRSRPRPHHRAAWPRCCRGYPCK